MNRRALTRRLLSPLALSNTALAWSVLIGIVGVIAFVPAQGAGLGDWDVWLVVALAAEIVFVATVIGLRVGGRPPGPPRVALALLTAGAARGVVIAVGAHLAGVGPINAGDVVGRAVNSAVFCLLGGALIGATLVWRQDFHDQYRVLVDRALLLERSGRDDAEVDDEVLASWASIKTGLDATLRRASAILAGDISAQGLNEAASLLTSAVDIHLRPASRAMWDGALPDRPPISMRSLFLTAVGSWQLPLRTILAFFAVLVGTGSMLRVGVIPGLWFTAQYLVVTGVVLGVSVLAARTWPGRTPVIATATLIALPVLLLACIALIADPVLGLASDPLSEAIVAIQAPITTVLIAMVLEAGRRRDEVLGALQARIDADAIRLLAQADAAHDDAQRLSVFMHHSVQSELAASAMQLNEAALTGEPDTMRSVSTSVLMRLGAIEDLDAAAPPWRSQTVGDQRIAEIVAAWTGILEVEVSLPEATACRRHQWRVAAQVIEEGLANAARHGDASRVVIAGRVDDSCLTLAIRDDGSPTRDAGASGESGIGMQWLDSIAPGDWALQHSAAGSTLLVTIR